MFVSIVIPCYNEASRGDFKARLCDFNESLKHRNNIQIVLVDDGSTDNTLDILADFRDNVCYFPCIVVGNRRNHGKGRALREGVIVSQGDYIMFIDADFAFNINEVFDTWRFDTFGQVVGRRVFASGRSKFRSFVGTCMAKAIHHDFKVSVSDTQCSMKVFKADVLKHAIKYSKCDRWFFDVELLYILWLQGMPVTERSIICNNMEQSTLSITTQWFYIIKEYISLLLRRKNLKEVIESECDAVEQQDCSCQYED